MKLKILLPTEIFLEIEITKITAEGENGHFTLLPRHIDFVSTLMPSILLFETNDHQTKIMAIDEGILVKCGQEVLVSVKNIIEGDSLITLQETVEKQFKILDEQNKKARTACANLEASLIRNFIKFDQ